MEILIIKIVVLGIIGSVLIVFVDKWVGDKGRGGLAFLFGMAWSSASYVLLTN